ncbi:hypothetical protein ABEP00_17490 [Heyndrickxia sporothermodurans]|uniref:hypothetical protein n=1 Tax=Heyndrickxia sporothermodurans TaxID=46224 RepID=UPI003D1BDA2F
MQNYKERKCLSKDDNEITIFIVVLFLMAVFTTFVAIDQYGGDFRSNQTFLTEL